MKKLRYLTAVLMLGLLVTLTSSTEPARKQGNFTKQRDARFHNGMHRGMNKGMNFQMFNTLTQEQKDRIEKIRIAQMKKALPVRNELGEYRAQLRTFTTGDKIDLKKAQKVLAKIEDLNTGLSKQRVRTQLDIRNVLTDEQKIMFDARSGMKQDKGFAGKGRGMKGSFGHGKVMPCAGQGMIPGKPGMHKGQGMRGMGPGMNRGAGKGMAMNGQRQGMMRGQGAGQGMGPGMGQGMKKQQGMNRPGGMGMNGRPGMNRPQAGMQRQMPCMNDLTQEQKDKLKELRLLQMKKMTQFKNRLNELKARIKTLTSVDNPDIKEINKVIEKMGEIKLEMAKNMLAHRMDVRSVLTDDQKVMFDMHAMKGRPGRKMM